MLTPKSVPSVEKVLSEERKLIELGGYFGLTPKWSNPNVATHLATQPEAMIAAIHSNIATLVNNLLHCQKQDIDPWDDREFFKLSMHSLGLSYPSDFLDKIGPGELIEGYDMNRFQIFRNMRFMEMINYSLVEVLTYEWPYLYDRASAITDKMIGYCDEILWVCNKTIPFDIPTHQIRESRSRQQQYFEISFSQLAPLFSGPNMPAGILGSFRAKALELQAHGYANLSFI